MTPPPVLYHGTAAWPRIQQCGWMLSTAGGGGRGLVGIWLSPDFSVAAGYAQSHARLRRFTDVLSERDLEAVPTVLEIACPDGPIADLLHTRNAVDVWAFLDVDLRGSEAAREEVRNLKQNGGSVSDALLARGYCAAWIPSTLQVGADPEICVFSPSMIHVMRAFELSLACDDPTSRVVSPLLVHRGASSDS